VRRKQWSVQAGGILTAGRCSPHPPWQRKATGYFGTRCGVLARFRPIPAGVGDRSSDSAAPDRNGRAAVAQPEGLRHRARGTASLLGHGSRYSLTPPRSARSVAQREACGDGEQALRTSCAQPACGRPLRTKPQWSHSPIKHPQP
jgi:hypothetical protein